MPLKAFVTELTEVEEGFRPLYEKTEEGYALSVDDSAYKKKIDEFRNNNRELHKKRTELEQKMNELKDIDPAKYAEAVKALDIIKQSEDAQLIAAGKWEEVIKKRTDNMRNTYEQQLKEKEEARKNAEDTARKMKAMHGNLLIESRVQQVISQHGQPKKGAMNDILNRARQDWMIDEDGETLRPHDLYNEKGDPMSLDDWARRLVAENAYLFDGQPGGGATGGSRATARGVERARTVSSDDPVEFGRNLKEIAEGKVKVTKSGT